MGAEKRGSRSGGTGGGYVGGFFHLFDWNAKSRKKLFSSKSEFSERPKQGKRSDKNLPGTRFDLTDEEDPSGACSSVRGSSDYSCASSVTDEEGYGSKAPGVVARLMGLNSLPTSSSGEPSSTPLFDTQSLQDAYYRRRNLEFDDDNHIPHSGNFPIKVEVPSSLRSRVVEPKPPKYLSSPIEKFQTEMLPPKSAKPISITHHKLLSPIKNPGFVSAKNKAHIMEIAAKIIEPGPQVIPKTRTPLVGSSSAPIKVRDLKEKAEAARKTPTIGTSSVTNRTGDLKEKAEPAQKISRIAELPRRPVESNAAKCLKGQSLNKSWNGSEDTSFRIHTDTKESNVGSKNKEKSISLAIQAKVNVQKREGLNSAISRSLTLDSKEQNEMKSSPLFQSQSKNQKSYKRSPNASGALRQNNHKQNCAVKDKQHLKPSNCQGRRSPVKESSSRHKTSSKYSGNSKLGSRKSGMEVKDSNKDASSSATNVPRKKRNINVDFQFEKEGFGDGLIEKYEKPAHSNTQIDSSFSWIEENRKKGTDIVSFTFTAPMTRPMPMPGSRTPTLMDKRTEILSPEFRGKRALISSDITILSSSLGLNALGSDALSILLEQKLRELTSVAGYSACDIVQTARAADSAPIVEYLVPNTSALGTSVSPKERNEFSHYASMRAIDSQGQKTEHKFQEKDEMDVSGTNQTVPKHSLDSLLPSPVSIFEGSFSTESCNSSRSTETSSTFGSKLCSSVEAREVIDFNPSRRINSVEADAELSDSASSTSSAMFARKVSTTFIATDHLKSLKWELEYVKQITCNIDVMFNDFAVGWASEIISPSLFNPLENRKRGLEKNGDATLLRRKLLFDCVVECLDLRCRRYVCGGHALWSKGVAMVSRKERLAGEVYKEISLLERMGDCMVDELVDKDMSSQYGRWNDFEVEESALTVELEGQIFESLVDEVFSDFLAC